MDTQSVPKLDGLTGLRYVAALAVLLAHVSANIPAKYGLGFFLSLGGAAMPLFFTLSGFLLAYTYFPAFSQSLVRPMRSFYVARLARIYPVYLLCLLLSFSFVGQFFQDLHFRRHDTVLSLGFASTMTHDWLHIPVFQGYTNPRTVAGAYMGVSWSVSAEIFFYLLFPFVASFLLTRVRSARQAGFLVVLLAGLYVLINAVLAWRYPDGATKDFDLWLHYLSPYVRFGEFLAGCLVGRMFLFHQHRPVSHWERRLGNLLLYVSLPAIFIITYQVKHVDSRLLQYYVSNFGLAPLCLITLYCLARYPSGLQRFLGSRPLVRLGEASYILYLIHPLFQSYCLVRTSGEGPLHNWYIVFFNHAAMLVTLHCCALGICRYFEEPMRKFLRQRLGGKGASGAAASLPGAEPGLAKAA
jgi:peptidoglycan/LPS O-acetylase OafA/YrhL